MTMSLPRTALKQLASFDGGVRLECALARPDRYRTLTSMDLSGPRISRGAGLSYSAASFGAEIVSLDHRRFNRVLDFDSKNGLVVVETGISLGELFDFLVPKGFFLGTQPGHPSISVGGCIAADVHGKNQFKDGNFSRQVEQITLFHPRYGVMTLSRDLEPDLFTLTCGGYGLTGSILSATLRVKPIPGEAVRLDTTVIEDFAALPTLLRNAATQSDLVYSWHDMSASAKPFGRGFLVQGSFVRKSSAPDLRPANAWVRNPERRLTAERRGRWSPALLNRMTVPLVNSLLFRFQNNKAHRYATLYESSFPLSGTASRYFDLYGSRGFHEYQFLLPCDTFESFAKELGRRVFEHRVPVSLASAKFFGGEQNLLRFDGDGVCFAINVPRSPESLHFIAFLDEWMIDLKGIPNIIKDSRLSGKVAKRAFPEFEQFRNQLLTFDPTRLYRSDLSQRIGL